MSCAAAVKTSIVSGVNSRFLESAVKTAVRESYWSSMPKVQRPNAATPLDVQTQCLHQAFSRFIKVMAVASVPEAENRQLNSCRGLSGR